MWPWQAATGWSSTDARTSTSPLWDAIHGARMKSRAAARRRGRRCQFGLERPAWRPTRCARRRCRTPGGVRRRSARRTASTGPCERRSRATAARGRRAPSTASASSTSARDHEPVEAVQLVGRSHLEASAPSAQHPHVRIEAPGSPGRRSAPPQATSRGRPAARPRRAARLERDHRRTEPDAQRRARGRQSAWSPRRSRARDSGSST